MYAVKTPSFLRPTKSVSLPDIVQEAQLMLTNQHDTFIGQSRSSNTVPFDMLGTVSY